MRILPTIFAFIGGWLVATVSFGMLGNGGSGAAELAPVILFLTLIIFFASKGSAAVFALGAGIGLDQWSSFPFPTWTAILFLGALVALWTAHAYLTNRSLVAMVALGLTLALCLYLLESAASAVWWAFTIRMLVLPDLAAIRTMVMSALIDAACLALVFSLHVRLRGHESAIRITGNRYG